MPSTRSKGAKKATEEEATVKENGDEAKDVSLVSFLELYKTFIETTADIMKDEVKSIQERKISKNKGILKDERRREAMCVGKNIVISFNDVITKAVKDLQSYSVQMSEELQARFNLPDDWMQSTSTNVSTAGSDVSGPVSKKRGREMEGRLGLLLAEASRRSELSRENGDLPGPNGCVEEDNQSNQNFVLTNGQQSDSEAPDDGADCNTGLSPNSKAAEETNTASERAGRSDSESSSSEKDIPSHDKNLKGRKGLTKGKSSIKSKACATPSKVDIIQTTSSDQKEILSAKGKAKDVTVGKSDKTEVTESTAIEKTPTPLKASTPAKSMPGRSTSTPNKRQDEEGDVDLFPSDEETITAPMENERGCSLTEATEKASPVSKALRTRRTEFETPEKVTNYSKKSSFASSSKKIESANKATPIQNGSGQKSNSDSDADSDTSVGTLILPKKTKEPKKIDLSVVKKERKSETAGPSKAAEIKNLTLQKSKPVKKEKNEDKADDDAENMAVVSLNKNIISEEKDATVDGTGETDFSAVLDETMTVVVPRTPLKTTTSSISKDSANEDIAKKLEKDVPSIEQCSDVKVKTEVKVKKEKKETNLTNEDKVNRELIKEEKRAMKHVLESSSDTDDEAHRSKTQKGKKELKKRKASMPETTVSAPSSPVSNKDDSRSLSKNQRLISSDLKLKSKCTVRVEKLPENVEKSLAEEGYVDLSGFSEYKRVLKSRENNEDDSSDDSDTSTSSTDSVKALERALKRLSKGSILSTIKHQRKCRELRRTQQKAPLKSRKDSAKSGLDALESTDSESNSGGEERRCEFRKGKLLSSDDNVVSLDSSDAEDLDPDSDNSAKGKKKDSRTSRSKQAEGKKKKYLQATISSSDSERDNMKEVLGSDSDSDGKKKKRTRTKRVTSESNSDSDFKGSKKKVKRRVSLESDDSDVKLVSESSDSSRSDSDFKSKKSVKRRRDSSEETKKTRKKKRKRIVNNDSDDSEKKDDSDIQEIEPDEASSSQKGRKNIRKIMSRTELAKSTKEAEREEEERKRRLTEKQSLFNGIHKVAESDKIERLILDVDPETKEPILEVDSDIVKHLKPHQAEGIKFMYNACYESIEMIKQNKVPGGCILAHCMGLGKTLQSIAFIHTLLNNKVCETKTALIICPLSTVNNWAAEIVRWTGGPPKMLIHKLYEAKNSPTSRKDYLLKWMRRGGIGIIHYDMFRILADPKGKAKTSSSLKQVFEKSLLNPGPDIVICDEGHLLKNCKSMLSLAVNNIRTRRRVVLTGTPLQNNLVEYHTMMNFVKPSLLGTLPEFTNRFVNPIKNGQHADSTEHDVKTMKRRAHVLHTKLDGCVQRRDYSILAPYLPPKHEYILNIKLSEKQEQLYKHYISSVVDPDPQVRRRTLLKCYAELVKVWSHPIALTMRRGKESEESEETSENDSIKDFIDDGSSSDVDASSDGHTKKKSKRRTRNDAANDPDGEEVPIDLESAIASGGWWNAVFKSRGEMEDPDLSGKLVILKEILKTCEAIGDRVLVFSQFLSSLDIIEEFLAEWDKETASDTEQILTFPAASGPQQGRWRRNIEYFRIDGQTKVQDRQRDCDKFNKKSSLSKAKLFLISTRAGGLGINLYGANRVVIFDASWNPSQDMQSIFRVYRFGQEKPCYIYRLIARGTMEEKILRRQITKLSLSSRVVDEHQIQRHFKFDDVNEMYVYDEEDPSIADAVLAVPKDRLLADLLISHREWIRGYEQFDSLLENKPDEGLTNEEKEIAWEEYRIESERAKLNVTQDSRAASNEAETFIKVKSRLQANHPHATENQLQVATRSALQVIEKIRQLIMEQNSHPIQMRPIYETHLTPLKDWLQVAVGPVPEAYPPVPPELPLLQPIPSLVPLANYFPNPQGYAGHHRPPIIRRSMPGLNPAANHNPLMAQQLRQIANGVSGIRPSFAHLRPGPRTYANPNSQRHVMSGQPSVNRSQNQDPLS